MLQGELVELFEEKDQVWVTVTDQGQGIPPEGVPKLFKPFPNIKVKATGGEQSTGLGLAISYRIVEGHGGRMQASSEVGRGSVFSFSLPRD